MMSDRVGPTPPQTVGPFFHVLLREARNDLVRAQTRGQRIRIEGRISDGAGEPISDAMVEIWQANAAGRYRHPLDDREELELDPAFGGYGRAATDGDGSFWFETIRPGTVPAPDGSLQAPHLNVLVFARGLLDRLATRLYFEDEPLNGRDLVLGSIPQDRRATLLARREGSAPGFCYRCDIVLQGPEETVFFDA